MIQRPGGSILEYIELKLRRDGRRKQDVCMVPKKKQDHLKPQLLSSRVSFLCGLGWYRKKGHYHHRIRTAAVMLGSLVILRR